MADNTQVSISSYEVDMKNAGYVAGAKEVSASSDQMVDSMVSVEVVTSKVGNEFTKLEGKINRQVAIKSSLINKIEQINRVAQEENITEQRRIALIEQYNAKAQQQIATLNAVGQAAANQNRMVGVATTGTRNMGFAVQNAAFQFGDLAVQIASGQGVLRPLIQQGSQFLQVFGVWGSVLGAIAAGIGVVVVQMGLFDGATSDAQGTIDDTNDRLEKMSDIFDELNDLLPGFQGRLQTALNTLSFIVQKDLERAEAELRRTPLTTGTKGGGGFATPQGAAQQDVVAQLRTEALTARALTGEFGDRFSGSRKSASEALDRVKQEAEDAKREAERAGQQATREAEREAEQREKARQSIEDQIDALSREADQIGMTGKARAVDVEIQKAEMTARRGNIELTDVQIEALTMEAEKKYAAAEASKAIAEAEKEREKAIKETAKEAERAAKEYERQLEQAANLIGDQVAMLTQAALGFEDWRDVAKQAINVVINELSKLESLGGSGGGIFDLLFKIGGAALGGAAGGIGSGSVVGGAGFGTPRAGGGPIEAGRIYTVGEMGPERIVSSRSGTVLPTSANGNGGPMVIHITNDFRGAFVDQNKIDAAIARSAPKQASASAAFISDKRQRGALPAFRN